MTSINDINGEQRRAIDPRVGICSICRHARPVTSSREAEFWRCGRSASDPLYPKYPALPVLRCAGYEPAGVAPVS